MVKNLFFFCFILFSLNCSKSKQNQQTQTTAPSMESMPSGEVDFTTPNNWIAEPPSNAMRKAQYKIPGASGSEDGELGVFFFQGAGGSVEANLSRWYSQFKQPDGSDTKDKVTSEKKEINGMPVTVVYVTGIYMKPRGGMMGGPVDEMKSYAMRAAIVETAGGPWFFKAVGPQTTIDKCFDGFNSMVQSFKIKK
jgi:hypothetical protein